MDKLGFKWRKDEWERWCIAYLSGYDKVDLKELKKELLKGKSPSEIVRKREEDKLVEEIGKLLGKKEIKVIVWGDDEYPVNLEGVSSQPLVLFVKGVIEPVLDVRSIAIVGTRQPTEYGIYWSRAISQKLVDYGWVVVSGLAFGIDGVVHWQVLKAGGRTIAVIPTGLDRVYPSSHQRLAEEIVRQGGCLVSEVGPGRGIEHRGVFPRRNRIIAGLSRFLIVIEGGKQSGTLTTANFMVNMGREVWALPGQIDNDKAWAPNFLIKNGAWPIIEEGELDEVLRREYKGKVRKEDGFYDRLDKEEKQVLGWLSDKKNIDELVMESGWELERLLMVLSQLELKGLVRVLHSGDYVRI